MGPLVALSMAGLSAQQASRGANAGLLAWSEALKKWGKVEDTAALHLARGVLFDCAAHRPPGEILFEPFFRDLAGNTSCRVEKHAQCAEQAERAFAKAVKLDASLTEARLRLAGARSERDPADRSTDLADIHALAGTPLEMRYIAAILLGKAAWARRDAAVASAWLTKAASLNRDWTTARLLLSATSPSGLPERMFNTSAADAMAFLALATLIAGGQLPQPQPRFAAKVEVVRFEVTVDRNDEAVTGLKAAGFSVTDSGVPVNDVSVREFADAPFDLILAVQPFASHAGDQIALFERTVRALFAAIRTSDRFGVVLAAQPPVRSRALADGPVPFDRQALAGTPYAVLFDALGAALTEFDDNDRRKIVLVVADGVDRLSALAEDMLAPLASRSQPKVVFLGASPTLLDALKFRKTISQGSSKTELVGARFKNSFPGEALRAVAENTGGRIVDLRDLEPETAVTRLITRLRSGYLLSFPSSKTRGWHPVSVKVKKGGAQVATRAGYFVD